MRLDPNLKLYKLPPRRLIRSEADVYILASAFPADVRTQFIGWYEGYKSQVTAPKPCGAGLTDSQLLEIFNRILDRLILLSRQSYSFESRHEKIEAPYDYFEFGQEYVRPLVNFEHSYVRTGHELSAGAAGA